MSIRDKLQIILITYNRGKYLENTLRQLFADNSPVKDFDITVLDNNSTDNTGEIIEKYHREFHNLSYIKNKYNVGLAGNIAKAIEYASKEYFWMMGDDDKLDWENWSEVEYAVNNNYDSILIALQGFQKENIAQKDLLHISVFVSGTIYKTSIIDDDVMKNIYDGIATIVPHSALFCSIANKNKSYYILKKSVAYYGYDGKTDVSYIRGQNKSDLYPRIANLEFLTGATNSFQLLHDNKLRCQITEELFHHKFIKKCKGIFKHELREGGIFLPNFFDLFINFNIKQRIIFLTTFVLFTLYYYLKHPWRFMGRIFRSR